MGLIERLHDAWGEDADCMNCWAEVRYAYSSGEWACYIYALNPRDNDEIACIIDDGSGLDVCDWSMRELLGGHNREGEFPVVDADYRRTYVPDLIKKLKERGREL